LQSPQQLQSPVVRQPVSGDVPEWITDRERARDYLQALKSDQAGYVGMEREANRDRETERDLNRDRDLNRNETNWMERLDQERGVVRDSYQRVDPGWSQPVNTGGRPVDGPVSGVRYNP